MLTTKPVRVWIRPLGQECRIRLESAKEAQWLLERLMQTHRFVGLQQVKLHTSESGCRFAISTDSQRTRLTLENTLAQISGLEMMLEPESV